MKTKILAVLGVFGVCQIASAGVLYWQVNTGASTKDVNDHTPVADFVQSGYEAWTMAQLVHYSDELATGNGNNSQANPGTPDVLKITPVGSSAEGTKVARTSIGDYSAFGSSIDGYSTGVFYIELLNDTGKVVGRSEALSATTAQQNWGSVAEFRDVIAWNGGNTYTAVPEPTSGLLMLLGMAGLALRRRKVA